MWELGCKISGEYFQLKLQNSGSSRHLLEGVTPQPILSTLTVTPLPKWWCFLSWTPSIPPPPAPQQEILEKGCESAILKQSCHSSPLFSWLHSLLSCCTFSHKRRAPQAQFFGGQTFLCSLVLLWTSFILSELGCRQEARQLGTKYKLHSG